MTTLTDDTLSTLLPIAGWDRKRASDVEIHGGADPILPTPFPNWRDRRREPGGGRTCRLGPLEAAHRTRPADRHKHATCHGIPAQQQVHEDGRQARRG